MFWRGTAERKKNTAFSLASGAAALSGALAHSPQRLLTWRKAFRADRLEKGQ
jgi:hypothetical protein